MGLLPYTWTHAKHKWTCASRKFDENNDNILIKLRVPFIKWPEYEEEKGKENQIPGRIIHDRAIAAVRNWAPFLRENAEGEQFGFHQLLTCAIQMHETLLNIIHTLPREALYLRLFYGVAADHVAELGELTGVKLREELPRVVTLQPNGWFKIREFPDYKARLIYAKE
ncbi:hypothetical protein CEP54_001965 [Fusarium duplospermum]|uniref:Uncharacterized protein n=1 Tax=Fusarium duplospermum TaxID=1325734 RepID=A0A428QXQ5_9HYPO|nr:hypothetical protein CEP54_001965 [Fusarium duplospermum]